MVQMQVKRECSQMSLLRVVRILGDRNHGLHIALRFWLAECPAKMIPSTVSALCQHFAIHLHGLGPSHFRCENEQQSQAGTAEGATGL